MAAANGHRPSLEMLGAPLWYVEGEKQNRERDEALEGRVSALEQAIVKEARAAGARSGQRWGAFLGALIAVLFSTLSSQCNSVPSPSTMSQSP